MGDVRPSHRLKTLELCTKCASIPFDALFGASRKARQRVICDLRHASAQSNKGCRFCAFLLQCHALAYGDKIDPGVTNPVLKLQVLSKDPEGSNTAEEPWLEQLGLTANAPTGLALWLQFVPHGNRRAVLEAPLICMSCVPSDHTLRDARGIVPRRRREEEVSSGMLNYDLIQKWLDICLHNHSAHCKRTAVFTRQILSLRLINVHTRELESAEHNRPYVALSYVWGSALGIQAHNVWETWDVESGTHILPSRVPQTIEDAMEVTKALGYGYLWVDAYCINQANQRELRHQIGNMHLVYECAVLTIAAMDGTHADAGLCGVSRTFKKLHQPTVGIPYGQFMATHIPDIWESQALSPWESRAWTLQELLLSKRVLFLHEEYAMMRCNAESFADVLDISQSPERPLFTQSTRYFWENGFDVILDDKEWDFARFNAFLANFTRRFLTNQSDVLLACQGALNQFTRNTGVGFARGLPRADISLSLLWRPHHAETLVRRPGFPTWSWAGWVGRSEYHYCIVNLPLYENEERAVAPVMSERSRREAKRQKMEDSAAQLEETAFIEIIGPEQSILQMGTQTVQVSLRRVKNPDKMSRVRYNKLSALPNTVTDFWVLLDKSGGAIANEVGELEGFKITPYSFRTDRATSEKIKGLSCRCQLVFVRFFPVLCDSREDGIRQRLFNQAACLIAIPAAAGNSTQQYERIGMAFLAVEDWSKLDPITTAVVIV